MQTSFEIAQFKPLSDFRSVQLALFFVILLVLVPTWAQAQQRLVINGLPVPGLSTQLVPGTAYVPAEPYARALGADYRFGAPAGVVLLFGGRLLTLRSFDTPAGAERASDALIVDGQTRPGLGAVRSDGTVYLPVKSVTAALGGRTAYLGAQGVVAVVFPRPRLLAAEPPDVWGSFERFVLTFSAPVEVEDRFEPSLNVVRFRFPRAELGDEVADEDGGGVRFRPGSRFSFAAFVPLEGFIDFNLTLQPGNSYSFFSEPFGAGERIVIDVFRSRPDDRQGDAQVPVVGTTAETLAFARRLQAALAAKGVRVELRPADVAGFGAPALLSLRRAPLATGRFNVYYLEDGAGVPTLDAPVRSASSGTLSDAARARVAGLAPDYGRGERLAQGVAEGLERLTLLRRDTLMAAPLRELSAAAGRGVLLELNSADLNAGLAEPLATALAPLLAPFSGR